MAMSGADQHVRAIIYSAANAVEREAGVLIPAAVRETLVAPVIERESFLASIEREDPAAEPQLYNAALSIFKQAAQATQPRRGGPPLRQDQQQQQQQQQERPSLTAEALLEFTWPWPIGSA